jgi:hypothetical protein
MLSDNSAKNSLKISLLFNILLFFSCWLFLYPKYGTVDDIEAQLTLSGKILGRYTEGELCWSHWFLGYIVAALYRLNETIPWYGLSLYLAHFVSMTAILFTLLRIKSDYWRLLIYLFCFCIAEIPLLQEVQFTSTAIITGGSGILLLCFHEKETHKGLQLTLFTLGTILFLWGAMIRKDAGFLILLVGIPFLFHSIYLSQKKIISSGKIISVVLLMFLIYAFQDQMVSRQPGWKDFFAKSATSIQGNILDYDYEGFRWNDQTAPIYTQKVGWSYNDYNFYRCWFMADSLTYGTQKLSLVNQHLGPRQHFSFQRFKERLRHFFYEKGIPDYWYYCFLALALLIPFLAKENKDLNLALITTFVLSFSVLIILLLTKHLPNRVSFPVLAMNLFFVMLNAFTADNLQLKFKKAFALMWILLLISPVKAAYKDGAETRKEEQKWEKALEELQPNKNQLYTFKAFRFYEPLTLPLKAHFRKPITDYAALDFGHIANTPVFYNQLKNFGIKNIFTEMIDNENVFIVMTYEKHHLDNLKQYMLEHYKLKIRYEQVREYPELNTVLYKVKSE